MLLSKFDKSRMVSPEESLPGRDQPAFSVPGAPCGARHPGNGAISRRHRNRDLWRAGCFLGSRAIVLAAGRRLFDCIGLRRRFNAEPYFIRKLLGQAGNAEVVTPHLIRTKSSYADLLKVFFEAHDPTQGMRQQNDIGTQYRSALYVTPEQEETAREVAASYSEALQAEGKGPVTTEIKQRGPFYYAEDYHQQYLHKEPNGYCGLERHRSELRDLIRPILAGCEPSLTLRATDLRDVASACDRVPKQCRDGVHKHRARLRARR